MKFIQSRTRLVPRRAMPAAVALLVAVFLCGEPPAQGTPPRGRAKARKASSRKAGKRKARARRRRRRRAKARRPAKATRKGRLPDARWLIKAAEAAINRGHLPKAVALYRGAVALRNQDPKLIYRLAEIYRMAGQFAEASHEFRRFIRLTRNLKKKVEARNAIKAMAEMPAPFVDTETRIRKVDMRFYALTAFRRGRRMAKSRKYRRAILYFQTALMMDPKLIGALRWLGQTYAKIRATRQAAEYYTRYLRIMPVGYNARVVRKRLKGHNVFGKLTLTSSFPCEVLVNRIPLTGKKTPVKNLQMPEGQYTVIFYNRKYKVGRKLRVFIRKGQTSTLSFAFGILEIKLKPWGRTRADGRDIGLWPQIGIPARARPYQLKIVSFDGKKRMTRSVVIHPGKTFSITRWQ